VERTGGRCEKALSSKNASQAFNWRAFFNLRPANLDPVRDSLLIPFASPACGPLPTPTEAAQDPPDVPGVIAHLTGLPNHPRHALQGPQVGGKTPAGGTFQQGHFQSLACLRRQARFTTGSPRAFQTLAPTPAPGPIPAVSSGATDLEPLDNFRLGVTLGKKFGGFQAAGLQCRQVPPGPKSRIHTPEISTIQGLIVTLFCEIH